MLAYLSLKGVLGMFRRRRNKMRGCSVGGCQADIFMSRLKQMLKQCRPGHCALCKEQAGMGPGMGSRQRACICRHSGSS